jgi:hypothetical protein
MAVNMHFFKPEGGAYLSQLFDKSLYRPKRAIGRGRRPTGT